MVTPIRYLTRDKIDQIPDAKPMIDGVLDKGTVALLVAEPGAGKSFLGIDWSACYATGAAWQGRTVDNWLEYDNDRPGEGTVVYVAAEGARGVKPRLHAWEQARRTTIPNKRLLLVPQPINLGDAAEVDMFVADLQRMPVGLVVFDTLARCAVGLEENSAREMGRVIDAAYRIREALGPDGTVLLIHHVSKGGAVRGSSALVGGVDQCLRLTRDGSYIQLSDEKRKDGQELAAMDLHLRPFADSLVIESATRDAFQDSELATQMRALKALGPLSKTELKAAAGLSDSRFYRELADGVKSGAIKVTNEKNPRYHIGIEGSTASEENRCV